MSSSPMTLAMLEAQFPDVPWRTPIRMTLAQDGGTISRWGCRVCIAREGIKGTDIPGLDDDPEKVRRHIELVHLP